VQDPLQNEDVGEVVLSGRLAVGPISPSDASIDALLALLRGRRSIRSFTEQPLPEGTLEKLIEAARWAPSASNRQPFRFVAITDRDLIARMAACVAETGLKCIESLSGEQRLAAERYAGFSTFFSGAPLVLAPFHRQRSSFAERIGLPSERDVGALASVSAAIMNLLLAVHVLGLGACWMTGPLLAADELERMLEIPKGWQLSGLIPVGYPAEAPAPPARQTVERLVRQAKGKAP
jgi:F420 biosynthesis protein FbiB-like protein